MNIDSGCCAYDLKDVTMIVNEELVVNISLFDQNSLASGYTYGGFECFETAIDSLGSGIWSFDAASASLAICKRCVEILQLGKTYQAQISSLRELISKEYVDHTIGNFLRAINFGCGFDVEFPLSSSNGCICKWLRVTGKTKLDKKRQIRVCGTLSDITDIKKSELLRRDILSMVTHDLRSPLSAIKLYVQMGKRLAKNLNGGSIVDVLEKADQHVEKINKMIQCLLEASVIERGKIQIIPAYFDMAELLSEIIADLSLLNIRHRFVFEKVPCEKIYADRDKIGQVIQNLLSNAIKYSSAENEILINCKPNSNFLRVSVTDYGIGIKSEFREKIFERFYRVESEQTKVIEGYGIGLYFSKQIILAHAGNIDAESRENCGSTFYFELPLSDKLL